MKFIKSILTSHRKYSRHLSGVFLIYFLLLFLFLFYSVVEFYTFYKQAIALHVEEESNLIHWENIIQKYPRYPDAYFQAAASAARLNNKQKAQNYVERALSLDPAFTQAVNLKKEIEGM